MWSVAHDLAHAVVLEIVQRLDLREPIVEFGSLQVEPGQPNDLRPLFAGRAFVGTDLRLGPGVDRAEDLLALSFRDGEVGTALCLDTLEHCTDPVRAGRELQRVVSPHGGVCVISSAMLMGIHAYPNDYWRFTPEGFRVVLEGFDDVDVVGSGDPQAPFWVFGIGIKGGKLPFRLAELPSLERSQREYERAEGKIKVGPFRLGLRELAATLGRELPRAIAERGRARLSGR